jgi:enoyl-CoA hydratase
MENNEVLLRREGNIAHITLNRPRALNALTYEMCAAILGALRGWANDPAIRLCVIDAVPGRAFCAGGDIRAIADKSRRRDGSAEAFFTTEYSLNAAIRHFPKPYIAVIDGIAMGGGVGVSVHGSHRVVSENVVFAMPETAIGLFPDVGTSYVLPRLPGQIGMYLALTGGRINAADMLYAGLATHFVPAARIGGIAPRLMQGEDPETVLAGLTADPGPSFLAAHREAIDRAFSAPSVEAILAALEAEGEWGRETTAVLGSRSPLSLKLTFQQMRLGKTLEFDDCLRAEYRLMTQLLDSHDFHEGVRAAVIDKDQRPYWLPESLAEVSDAEASGYFELRNVTALSL